MKFNQVIRKLKKENRELYDVISSNIKATSPKNRDNEKYWNYCKVLMYDEDEYYKYPDYFYFKSTHQRNNCILISNLGRLLMSGWCCSLSHWEFTKQIYHYVYNAYYQELDTNASFEKTKLFKNVVIRIRQNLNYYFHNQGEAKLYILESFFPSRLKQVLPEQPKELDLLEKLKEEKSRDLKQPKEMIYLEVKKLQGYIDYLKSEISLYDIDVLSIDQFEDQQKEYRQELKERILRAKDDYRTNAVLRIGA